MATILTFVFTLCSTLINGQKIILDQPRIISPCKNGLRKTLDSFIISGRLGPDFNALLNATWSPSVTVDFQANKFSGFGNFCTISIGMNGKDCNSRPVKVCYCSHFDQSTGYANIIINSTAEINLSEAQFRVQWENTNKQKMYSNTTVGVPEIYDEEDVNLKMTVNDHKVEEISNVCQGTFEASKSSTVEIELCCYTSASPCYVKIASTKFVVASKPPACATYTLKECNTGSIIVNNSYSLCTMTDYKLVDICKITLRCVADSDPNVISTTPENKKLKKSSYNFLMGLFGFLLVVICVCGCQAAISKYLKGVWCHYLECYEEEVDNKSVEQTSVVSVGRKASGFTTDDETVTLTTSKSDLKSNVSPSQIEENYPINGNLQEAQSINALEEDIIDKEESLSEVQPINA